MTPLSLPDVGWQLTTPRIVRSVSVARAGDRTMSVVETADPFWQVPMATIALDAAEVSLLEAFRDEAREGERTVLWTPQHVCVPRHYWGNADDPAVSDDGVLDAASTAFSAVIGGVANGLRLMRGDLIGFLSGEYRAMCRVMTTSAVAAAGTITVAVEPSIPPYITVGATVSFKSPGLNMRVVRGSFVIPDQYAPEATFALFEVPK